MIGSLGFRWHIWKRELLPLRILLCMPFSLLISGLFSSLTEKIFSLFVDTTLGIINKWPFICASVELLPIHTGAVILQHLPRIHLSCPMLYLKFWFSDHFAYCLKLKCAACWRPHATRLWCYVYELQGSSSASELTVYTVLTEDSAQLTSALMISYSSWGWVSNFVLTFSNASMLSEWEFSFSGLIGRRS